MVNTHHFYLELGDAKAKVGTRQDGTGSYNGVLGPYGVNGRNEAGEERHHSVCFAPPIEPHGMVVFAAVQDLWFSCRLAESAIPAFRTVADEAVLAAMGVDGSLSVAGGGADACVPGRRLHLCLPPLPGTRTPLGVCRRRGPSVLGGAGRGRSRRGRRGRKRGAFSCGGGAARWPACWAYCPSRKSHAVLTPLKARLPWPSCTLSYRCKGCALLLSGVRVDGSHVEPLYRGSTRVLVCE